MEQQVAEAALAIVRPNTDGTTRKAASHFLEQWTHTPEAWSVYASWLHSFNHKDNGSQSHVDAETIGMQLLCLTLLQSKIRREVRCGTTPNASLATVQNEIASLLQQRQQRKGNSRQQQQQDDSIITPLCICMAALAARCRILQELVLMCCGRSGMSCFPLLTTLRILACIPSEIEAISDLTTSQVTQELRPFLEIVLDTIKSSLSIVADIEERTATAALRAALEALRNWASTCHVSLSQLNIPTCGGNESLLPSLVQLLSNASQQSARKPEIWISASQALTETILVPSDSCTQERRAASASLLHAVTYGFVSTPLEIATQQEWTDASHALATLFATLVTEEVDDFCTQPAEQCLNLLLKIQSHPHTPVAIVALECWLTVQEVPTASRHDNWKSPLFVKVVEGLLSRIAYTRSFAGWENELEVLDQSEFEQLRRMVTDVFVSSYFLLRSQFVQMMVSSILVSLEQAQPQHQMSSSSSWTVAESALFCLCTVSREVCARVKTSSGGKIVSSDREATALQLLHLVERLCSGAAGDGSVLHPAVAVKSVAQKHLLVLAGVANFVGAYAPAWNAKCSPESLLALLAYLREAMLLCRSANTTNVAAVVLDAAKASRSILVGCSSRLLTSLSSCDDNDQYYGQLLSVLRETMNSVLDTGNEDGMSSVTEGCTRLLVQVKRDVVVRRLLATVIVKPLLLKSEAALDVIITTATIKVTSEQQQRAVEWMCKYLHVWKVVIQFCGDINSGSGDANESTRAVVLDILAAAWPVLERTTQCVLQYEFMIDGLLAVYEQVLQAISTSAADAKSLYLEPTIKFVVQVFGSLKNPRCLGYIAKAVEVFGTCDSSSSFEELLNHVSMVVFSYVSTERSPNECPELIRSFFEMNQRYIIFCPAALVGCRQFPAIVEMAVDCLSSCHGERESTRATLNFLAQLFGWRSLRVNASAAAFLESSANRVDERLVHHGSTIIRSCVAGLLGGPTMLCPALSECIFAVIHVVAVSGGKQDPQPHGTETLAHLWMFEAAAAQPRLQGNSSIAEMYRQVVHILIGLARNGSKSKPKAKMLLMDFVKIAKGDMTPDALLSYTL